MNGLPNLLPEVAARQQLRSTLESLQVLVLARPAAIANAFHQ
jgi:hypothetical protein